MYAKNAISNLRFCTEAQTTRRQSAPSAKEKISTGSYLFLDSHQATSLSAQGLKPAVPLVLRENVIPVDEENKINVTL